MLYLMLPPTCSDLFLFLVVTKPRTGGLRLMYTEGSPFRTRERKVLIKAPLNACSWRDVKWHHTGRVLAQIGDLFSDGPQSGTALMLKS